MNVNIVSLGCDKNLVDSEMMLGLIKEAGYSVVNDEAAADVIIVNTCGFIKNATAESIEVALDVAKYKSGACKALILAGCMVSRYRDDILKELPEVDAVVGVNELADIVTIIKRVTGDAGCVSGEDNTASRDALYLKRQITGPGYFSYLKIAEGCDNRCTYCTIPSIRGGYRSRTLESLIAEAEMLAASGVKELVLVAQDTAVYGRDLYGESRLHQLLERLSEIAGINWIRLMYCYPEHITNETIATMARLDKVCKYIDMPVQHAADRILRLMGRRSSTQQLRDVIARLRSAMPDIAIRTTLMAGFPGETDEDFQIMADFIKEVGFDMLGVISYSREEGTPAHDLPEQLADSVKEKRNKTLMRIQRGVSRAKNESRIGQTYRVIVDGRHPDSGLFSGRTFRSAYDIDGAVLFPCDYELMAGEFVDVKITSAGDYDLTGEIIF